MLDCIELENFKAFGKRVRIPCAPITLIFGQNSAGKSSVLQALNLLKQTRENRDTGTVLLPRADKGIVDLGSFQDLLYDHDLRRSLRIRLLVNIPVGKHKPFAIRALALKANKPIIGGIELAFHRRSINEEVKLKELLIFLTDTQVPFASLKYTDPIMRHIRNMIRFRSPELHFPRQLNMAKLSKLSSNPIYWTGGFKEFKEHKNDILSGLKNLRKGLIDDSEEASQRYLFDIEENEGFSKDKYLREIEKAISFYSTDFSEEQFSHRMSNLFKNTIIGLEGFLPITQSRYPGFAPEIDILRDSRLSPSFFMRRPDPARLILTVSRQIDEFLEQLFPLGPFRRPPERWYIFTGTSPQDVGYLGNSLPDLLYRNPSLVKSTNNWLRKLEIGYKLSVKPVGRRAKDLFEVRLVDILRKDKIDVCLADVGFGISQLLPFIVQSLASENQIITIEQPEIHVHPKLQADLGDLMIEAIHEPRNNQFLIETHSEHLILRLLRRIRETTEGDLPHEVLPLRPNQLAVFYVQRGDNGSEVIHIPVNAEGEFKRPWPQGFFGERARELF